MTKMTLSTAVVLSVAILAIGVAQAGKKEKSKITEETVLGAVSCTVAAPKPPTLVPGPNGVPQVAAPVGTTAGPTSSVVPQPINTVRDCLSRGGQVVIHPDGGRTDLAIDNPEVVKGHEWHRVSISGYLNGTLFHIMSLRRI